MIIKRTSFYSVYWEIFFIIVWSCTFVISSSQIEGQNFSDLGNYILTQDDMSFQGGRISLFSLIYTLDVNPVYLIGPLSFFSTRYIYKSLRDLDNDLNFLSIYPLLFYPILIHIISIVPQTIAMALIVFGLKNRRYLIISWTLAVLNHFSIVLFIPFFIILFISNFKLYEVLYFVFVIIFSICVLMLNDNLFFKLIAWYEHYAFGNVEKMNVSLEKYFITILMTFLMSFILYLNNFISFQKALLFFLFSILISTTLAINFDENAFGRLSVFINWLSVWAFVNFIIKNYKVLVGFILYLLHSEKLNS